MTWRLTLLLTCLALATSRLGLVAHELVGHGGVAVACGGNITQVKLFWFAGGWITYDLNHAGRAAALAVTLGGMAIEVVIGSALWCLIRGDSLGARLVRGTGAALIVHAGFYFAAGAWHGYGDGQLLYHELGEWRPPVAIAVGLGACAMAFSCARWVVGAIRSTAPALGVVVALVGAAAINIGLDAGELALRTDRTYSGAMARENERVVAIEMARIERTRTLAPDEREQLQAKLEDDNRQFPFRWLLGGAIVLGFVAGAIRSPRRAAAIDNRLLARAAIAAGASLALVIVLSLVM